MIPESVKARIEQEAEIKFTTNHLSTTGFIAMPMAQQRAYISGATAEYEGSQILIDCLTTIRAETVNYIIVDAIEQAFKNYNQ